MTGYDNIINKNEFMSLFTDNKEGLNIEMYLVEDTKAVERAYDEDFKNGNLEKWEDISAWLDNHGIEDIAA